MKKHGLKNLCALIIGALTALSGCGPAPSSTSRTFMTMGTFLSVTLVGADSYEADRLASLASDSVGALENRLSIFKPESDVFRLNNAGGREVALAPETMEMLSESARYHRLSGGAFDPSVGPLMELWGFRGRAKPEQAPAEEEIRAALRSVGFQHVEFSNGTARIMNPTVRIDLGGIAKGYAVDVACARLAHAGCKDAMIDLGGNIRCLGLAKGRRPWRIGVRDPFNPSGIVGAMMLSNGMAAATSGHYEQFVETGGERYGHIMDPRTGYPARGMAAVTVISPSAMQADALSTSVFILGIKEGAALISRLKGCRAVFIPDKQPIEIWITEGMKDIYVPMDAVKDRTFTLPRLPGVDATTQPGGATP